MEATKSCRTDSVCLMKQIASNSIVHISLILSGSEQPYYRNAIVVA